MSAQEKLEAIRRICEDDTPWDIRIHGWAEARTLIRQVLEEPLTNSPSEDAVQAALSAWWKETDAVSFPARMRRAVIAAFAARDGD